MTIEQLIDKLNLFPKDIEVVLCDQRSHQFHLRGEIVVAVHECPDGEVIVELGCKQIVEEDDSVMSVSDCDDGC